MRAEAFAGPLPPPAMLADYNNLVPRGAERIMAMAEKQQDHRHNLEKQVIEGNLAAQKRGQVCAFILALIVILGGIYLIATGLAVLGFVALVTAVGGLAATFIIGKKRQEEDLREKRERLPDNLK